MSNIVSEGEDKLNIEDGYFTRKSFKIDNKSAWQAYEKTIPQIVKDTKQEIKGRYWYLTTMTLPAGILFPHGTAKDYKWVVAPISDLQTSDQDAYSVPGKSGEFYKSRVAIEGAKQFDEFKEALVYLGMQ
jgi:hypothetical protein